MKQLYFLLILTLSFGVYSQGIFTYNFDDNAAGVKTAIDASESSWGGSTTGDNNQKPAAAGYMGVIGTDANPTLYPGCMTHQGRRQLLLFIPKDILIQVDLQLMAAQQRA